MSEEQEQKTMRVEGIEIPVGGEPGTEGLVPPPTEDTSDQEILQTEAAFIVYMDQGGKWVARDDLLGKPIAVGRAATLADMYHAGCDLVKDCEAIEAAQRTAAMQMQMGQALMKAQREQAVSDQVAQQLAGHGKGAVDLTALR